MTKHEELKPFPTFASDAEAERFVETADLSEYDFSGFRPTTFEFAKKDVSLKFRTSTAQADAMKAAAQQEGIPYTKWLRRTIDKELARLSKSVPQ